MKLSRLALAVATLSSLPLVTAAQDNLQLPTSVVTGNRLAQQDFVAPYASEIHNHAEIKNSGAISIYDYLGRFSSVNVTPDSGNQFQQKLDMRGYGIGDGHQNIVVTLNGRRLNNIDMYPQFLGNIPLTSIERIEIIKGSGAVAHGDGAMAGVINIVTRDAAGADLSMAAGSDGYLHTSVRAGLVQDKISLQLLADNSSSDGLRKADGNGNTDESDADNLSLDLKLQPVDGLELRFGRDRSRIDTLYGSPITRAQFNRDPELAWGGVYNGNKFSIDTTRIGASFQANDLLSFNLDYAEEDKKSEFLGPFQSQSDYEYRTADLSGQLNLDALTLLAGVQLFDGERTASWAPDNKTTKDNKSVFMQGQYELGSTRLSAGVRHEKVDYEYRDIGVRLKDDHQLTAWDLGINHQYSEQLSVFANISKGFQAPDIDRFFAFDSAYRPVFNGMIKPAKSKNLNVGLNHISERNQLKLTVFYTRLRNEIFYFIGPGGAWDPNSKNTNLDKSHKYGLELQDRFKVTEDLTARINYAYTVAKIDREDEGGGAYNGKKLPGVSAHSITAGLDYRVLANGTLSLTQNWRSRAYAMEDFANVQRKQKAFNSTDIGYSHNFEQFTLFAHVSNVFDKKNGISVHDDAIYPVTFTRTWHAGARISF